MSKPLVKDTLCPCCAYPLSFDTPVIQLPSGERFCSQLCMNEWLAAQAYKESLKNLNVVAVLPTTIIAVDGTYRVTSIIPSDLPDISGVLHYIGHDDTRAIAERLGAVPSVSRMYGGLQVGETAVCLPLKRNRSNRNLHGYTQPDQRVTIHDINLRLLTRLE